MSNAPDMLGKHRLDIVFPGLFSSASHWLQETGEIRVFPVLERFLHDAEEQEHASRSYEALLLSLATGAEIDGAPVAAIRQRIDRHSQTDSGLVLCADPISITAGMNDLTIVPVNLETHELEPLAALVNAHLKDHDLAFELSDGQSGLCSGFSELDVTTVPLSIARNSGLRATLPSGPAARFLQSLSTEIQMLLFDAPFNQRREADGLPPVNGLWFWGEGELPELNTPYQHLSGGKLVSDLARVSGLSCVENNPISFLADTFNGDTGAALVELIGLDQTNYADWSAIMERYEREFFLPLQKLVGSNPTLEVRLFDDQQRCFIWQRRKFFSFLRKPKSFSAWVDAVGSTDE